MAASRSTMSAATSISSGHFSLKGAGLEPFVWQRGGRSVATGTMDAAANFEATGRSPAGLVSALTGGGTLAIHHGEARYINPRAASLVIKAADLGQEFTDQALERSLRQLCRCRDASLRRGRRRLRHRCRNRAAEEPVDRRRQHQDRRQRRGRPQPDDARQRLDGRLRPRATTRSREPCRRSASSSAGLSPRPRASSTSCSSARISISARNSGCRRS